MIQNGAPPILMWTVGSKCECGVSTSDIWYGWGWLGLWRNQLNQIYKYNVVDYTPFDRQLTGYFQGLISGFFLKMQTLACMLDI